MEATPETLLARIGQMILRWNDLEDQVQQLLRVLCEGDDSTLILTAHMSSAGLLEALETASNELGPEEAREHIEHARKWFEILREYRNYYVHGARCISLISATEFGIFVSQSTSRRRLSISYEILSEQDLADLLQWIHSAAYYMRTIWRYLVAHKHRHLVKNPLHPLPEKPLLPGRLKKLQFRINDPDPLDA